MPRTTPPRRTATSRDTQRPARRARDYDDSEDDYSYREERRPRARRNSREDDYDDDGSSRGALLRRIASRATSRLVLAPLLVAALIGAGVLFYYYNRYSEIIDAGLRGDIFVRSSGIYAAPLTLHTGASTNLNNLVAHLRGIGYVERAGEMSENQKKGKYLVRGASVEIYPGSDVKVDGAKAFDNLRVSYSRNGEAIQSLTDLDNGQQMQQSQVEPELISSVVNQGREKRKIIEFKDLPKSLVDAITTVEDRDFFDHNGVSVRGTLRALFRDYQAGELKEGGSSITQQLVKTFFLNPEKSWKRKLSEAYMSIILEQRLTKEEIMAMYCNQIYLGQRGGFSVNGFGEAARAYFGKDVSNIGLPEAAMLAGIIRSPNYYSPYSHEDRAKERRNMVLELMVTTEKATRDQAEKAKTLPLGLANKAGVNSSDAPYFIDYMTRQLEREYDDRNQSLRSLRVYSTIDLDLQHAAYEAVTKQMHVVEQALSKRRGGTNGLQAALVAMNARTGEIVAMVGGRDYASSQLNRATEARRQPGSVFKPFVYATALTVGADDQNEPITPATTFMDEPHTFANNGGQPYSPGNFGDKFEMRPMTVRDALVNSKNVITVEIAERVGFNQVAQMAERAGLQKVPTFPSMALGVGEATPLQMAAAYTSFANSGRRVAPVAIKRVTTKDGTTLFEAKTETREVMTPQVAYVMTSMMQDVLTRGTGTRVRQMGFTGTAAGKTGSSRDAWFAGYTPNLVCVVWIGFDDNSDIGLTGGVAAAPIWGEFMMRALRLRPEFGGQFEDPGNIVAYEIDPGTGGATSSGGRRELFIEGTGPSNGTPLPEASRPDRAPIPDAEPNTEPNVDPNQTPSAQRPATRQRYAGVDDPAGSSSPANGASGAGGRRERPRPDGEQQPDGPKGRSFFGRVKDIFKSDKPSADPAPTPTPQAQRVRPFGLFLPLAFALTSYAEPAPQRPRPAPTPTGGTRPRPAPTAPAVVLRPRPTRPRPVATRPRTVTAKAAPPKPSAITSSKVKTPRPVIAGRPSARTAAQPPARLDKTGKLLSKPAGRPQPVAAAVTRKAAPAKPAPTRSIQAKASDPSSEPIYFGGASKPTAADGKNADSKLAKVPKVPKVPDKKVDKKAERRVEGKPAKREEKKPEPKMEARRAEPKTQSDGKHATPPTIKLPPPAPVIYTPPAPAPDPPTQAAAAGTSVARGAATFTLLVCSQTGLLYEPGVCPTPVRKRFKLGSEPTKHCGPEHHPR